MEIARRSRGTPRIANNLLRRVRDYAQVRGDGRITVAIADQAMAMLAIDQNGLDEMDKRILETIVVKFAGGPVGLGFPRRGRRRGSRHHRGSLRAFPDHGRLPQPHRPGPRRHRIDLQKTRPTTRLRPPVETIVSLGRPANRRISFAEHFCHEKDNDGSEKAPPPSEINKPVTGGGKHVWQ